MTINVAGCVVRIDGIKVGPIYGNHAIALHQANREKELHYPHATIVDDGDVARPVALPPEADDPADEDADHDDRHHAHAEAPADLADAVEA